MTIGKDRRKIEVDRLREEGREAFRQGKSAGANPYPRSFPNNMQWFNGWAAENIEFEEKKAKAVEAAKMTIEQMFPNSPNAGEFYSCAICGAAVMRNWYDFVNVELHYAYHKKRGDL